MKAILFLYVCKYCFLRLHFNFGPRMGLNEFVLFVDFVGISGVRNRVQLIYSVKKLLLLCLSLLVIFGQFSKKNLWTAFCFGGVLWVFVSSSVNLEIVFVFYRSIGKLGQVGKFYSPPLFSVSTL